MKPILRTLLLLAMGRLAYQALIDYAFTFQLGYPLLPLAGLAACFWAYTKLETNSKPGDVVYTGQWFDSFLILLLAVTSSYYILETRKEAACTGLWMLHLATLTSLQFLVPRIAARAIGKAQMAICVVTALVLFLILWEGTAMSRTPAMTMDTNNVEMQQADLRGMPSADNRQLGHLRIEIVSKVA